MNSFVGRIGELVRTTLDRFRQIRGGWGLSWTGRSQIDYAGVVGDGSGSSIVVSCLNTLCTAFTEPPLWVRKQTEDGWQAILGHAMVELLTRPNKFMSGRLFFWAIVASLKTDGNAYAIKVRSEAKRVVELWPVPPGLMTPVWEGNDYISAYRYAHGQGAPDLLSPDDVIHWRWGIDPLNTRKGLGQLRSLVREIYTDLEAGDYTSQVLFNLGVPSLLISPGGDVQISQDDADAVKAGVMSKWGGDKRGQPMVMTAKTEVKILSWSPEQLNLQVLRRLPEERICAVLGVPPIVAHLGSGLDSATYSNYEQARSAFFENTMIPLFSIVADELRAQLLPEFGSIVGMDVSFDLSNIRVLQEDVNKAHERARANVAAGIWTINEGRIATGREQDPAGDVYLVPKMMVLIPWQGYGDRAAMLPATAPVPLQLRSLKALPSPETKEAADSDLLEDPDEAEAILESRLAAVAGLDD